MIEAEEEVVKEEEEDLEVMIGEEEEAEAMIEEEEDLEEEEMMKGMTRGIGVIIKKKIMDGDNMIIEKDREAKIKMKVAGNCE